MIRNWNLLLLATLASLPAFFSPARCVVTSDVSGSHTTTPGVPVFGLDHDGVGKATVFFDDGFVGTCTASLLSRGDGRFAILAGHCVGEGVDFAVTSVEVTWELAGGPVTATASVAAGQVLIHPVYTANEFDVFKGNDLAFLEFTDPVPQMVPRYELYTGCHELDTQRIIVVGYGLTGHGSTGSIPGSDGTKRAGLNRWEAVGLGELGAPLFSNDKTQLTFDFDGGLFSTDAFGFFFGTSHNGPLGGNPIYDDPIGFGDDEVCVGVGDSGGPAFLFDDGIFKIAGVASYGTRLVESEGMVLTEPAVDPPGSVTSDVDTTFNSSWGELFVHTRLSHPTNRTYIDSVLPTAATDGIFADGFECGDPTAWSEIVGGQE